MKNKTYQDFKEFHSKLVKQFPEEADLPRQDRKLPFFSGNPGTNVTKEDEQTIAQYTKHLLQMPKPILDSELVVNFFRGENNTNKSLNAKSTTPVNATTVSKEADTVIGYPPVQVVNSPNPADEPQPMQSLAPFPASCIVTQRLPHFVSPSHSPQSVNLMSPSNRSNTPEEQEGTNQIKEANVNQNCIEKAPPIKHSSMDENGSLALTQEQAANVRLELALKRDKLSNGLIDNYQQVPQIWNPQMIQPPFQAMPHPPVQVLQHHLPASQTSTRDSSPSGSDYSSPLQSPSLRKKTVITKETDSSSEENEKEKTHQNGSPHLRRLHKTISGDGYCQEGYEVGGLVTLTGGYQSDPSTGYYPVINPQRPLKAQPAHTSKAIPPNSIINMPGDSLGYGKRTQVASIPIGMAPSIPRSDASTMTSSSNVTSVTTHLDNSGKSRIPYPYAIRPVSGHRTLVCSVTDSTSVTLSNSNSITPSPSVNGLKPQMTHSLSETSISNVHSQEQAPHPSMGQPQTIPTSTPNMQHLSSPAHSTCSSCGCTGNSGTTASYPLHFIPSQMFHSQQLFPWTTAMTHSTNGLIHHPFIPPYHYQPFQNLNGVAHQEYLLNNHHHNFVHTHGLPLAGPTGNAPGPIMNQGLQRSNSIKEQKEKPRVVSCYNCGSHDHLGHDCSENSMESILGHYHLNYEPKE